ncbi:class I SAM-dependent methyltransferase [Mycolicibacterium palauense]|uniref:class I SAM-dependent methyltransferase n=1 Tax=Mycolicibacterium palauense TaxID=2034511 RepID=UPI00159BA50C|nr:methyltransferase domain-containing protein [Mycolicibacterium palauense]
MITATTGTVLELGAGDGAFQQSVISKGVSPTRLHAAEFNSVAREKLQELGVKVTGTDFRELPSADHSVVCGHQVFEHLDNLGNAFKAFDRLTAPDGVVAVSVPNGTHIERMEEAGGEIDMPPNHVSTWRLTAFNAVARRNGWQIVDYKEEPISRFRAAKELAISRTFRARTRPVSFAAAADRWSPSPRVRYALMGTAAASKFPSAYVASVVPYGGSLWVAMQRAE